MFKVCYLNCLCGNKFARRSCINGPIYEIKMSSLISKQKCTPHLQGGVSSGYKNYISENGVADETYSEDGVALFRVQGSGPENMQAIQVAPVLLVPFLLFSIDQIMISIERLSLCFSRKH